MEYVQESLKKGGYAQDLLWKKFMRYTAAPSDCPILWAEEVLKLMETLDSTFGIKRKSYGHSIGLFSPIRYAYNFILLDKKKPFFKRLGNFFYEVVRRYLRFLWEHFKSLPNHFHNWITKPRLEIDQIKSKFDTLRIYYKVIDAKSFPFDGREFSDTVDIYGAVDTLIKKTEIRLAMKGVYYGSLESLLETKLIQGGEFRKTTTPYQDIYDDLIAKGQL